MRTAQAATGSLRARRRASGGVFQRRWIPEVLFGLADECFERRSEPLSQFSDSVEALKVGGVDDVLSRQSKTNPASTLLFSFRQSIRTSNDDECVVLQSQQAMDLNVDAGRPKKSTRLRIVQAS